MNSLSPRIIPSLFGKSNFGNLGGLILGGGVYGGIYPPIP